MTENLFLFLIQSALINIFLTLAMVKERNKMVKKKNRFGGYDYLLLRRKLSQLVRSVRKFVYVSTSDRLQQSVKTVLDSVGSDRIIWEVFETMVVLGICWSKLAILRVSFFVLFKPLSLIPCVSSQNVTAIWLELVRFIARIKSL